MTVYVNAPVLRQDAGQEVRLGELPHHVFTFKHFRNDDYRAFCAGSIITALRVLSSANCFITNRKRLKVDLSYVKVVGGILNTVAQQPATDDDVQQWRTVVKIYSQKYYRFPANSHAILEVNEPFIFNDWVNSIPYASLNQNYDGVCVATVLKPTTSWGENKKLYTEILQMVPRNSCERLLLKSCKLYYCTAYRSRYIFAETEGGGLICHGTNDPMEVDVDKGVLVGVTALINVRLPTLHAKVSIFHKWIKDDGRRTVPDQPMVFLCFYIIFLNKLL